jgi:hypothetical protein
MEELHLRMLEIDADELHPLGIIFLLGARSFPKLLPPSSSSSSSFKKEGRAPALPSLLHLVALAGVPLVADELIPSPIYPHCSRFGSPETPLEHNHH